MPINGPIDLDILPYSGELQPVRRLFELPLTVVRLVMVVITIYIAMMNREIEEALTLIRLFAVTRVCAPWRVRLSYKEIILRSVLKARTPVIVCRTDAYIPQFKRVSNLVSSNGHVNLDAKPGRRYTEARKPFWAKRRGLLENF